MTEAEWLACGDPLRMLDFLRGKASDRKLRLFVCACCRCVWHLITDEAGKRAVKTGERVADRLATDEERSGAWSDVMGVLVALQQVEGRWGEKYALLTAERCVLRWREDRDRYVNVKMAADSARAAAEHSKSESDGLRAALRPHFGCPMDSPQQSALLRDIIGNPFRPVTLDPTRKTPTIVQLAQGIYEERAFDRLPILADALEEAGCQDAVVLGHCRGAGPHVRGCWAVDLILGKL